MSIEDINYLKNNSIKQNYTFLIDSTDRDRDKFPNPNKYVVEFTVPFKNVIGMEIIDASIPRTMYNIDIENNLIYYYLGTNEEDNVIKNGVTEKIACNLIKYNCSYIDSYTLLENSGYIELSNNINIYNIYANYVNTYGNETLIGGNELGITYSFKVKAEAIYNYDYSKDNTYCIFSFGYYHLWNQTNTNYTAMTVNVLKIIEGELYDIQFIIGDGTIEGDKNIIANVDLSEEVHICWTILENKWNIYISNNSLSLNIVQQFTVKKTIKNVFYIKKYIGRSLLAPITLNKTGNNYKGYWNDGAKMYIKDFKIYNRELKTNEIALCRNNTIIKGLTIWYKLYDNDNDNDTKNYGENEYINYIDIFNKISIDTGDYTFKTFLLNYEEKEDSEIGFKKHSEPAELTNLIDIYSRLPFILDMERSTIYENLGFDLYNSINPLYINDRYQYKSIYNTDRRMYKMFHSIINTKLTKVIDNIEFDKNIITSPGIVYLIGNKYIVLKCPEIEEHLFGSLSYSKYSLGLAKFRVDNMGINSERLAITKLPIREFHPIGKLSRISLRFETNKGLLYDFKGVNHNIVFAIYYYEPKQNKFPEGSILNPEYKMNYIDYQYYQEEIEGDSDDENEEYSRDNIDYYKKREIDYSNEGIKLTQFNKNFVNNNNDDDN